MAKKRTPKELAKRAARRPASKAEPRGVEFGHLFIGTADFAGSCKFWTEVVGLRGQGKWGNPEYAGTVGAGSGSFTIAQSEEGPCDELGYKLMSGNPQLSLRAPHINKLHAKLAKRGAKVLRPPLTTHYGVRCFSVEGPDGMAVLFTEKR